jgi:hypothetical protein
MTWYFFTISVLAFCYVVTKYLSGKKCSKYKIVYQELICKIEKILCENDLSDVQIVFGKYYAFFRTRNVIQIKKKDVYTGNDLFICLHEIGHCMDYKNSSKMIEVLYAVLEKITILFLAFFLPVTILLCIFLVFGSFGYVNIFIMFCFMFVLCFFKIVSIPFFEMRANRHGIRIYREEYDMSHRVYRFLTLMAWINQLVFWLLLQLINFAIIFF